MSNFKQPIVRSEAHLDLVRSLPCLATGKEWGVVAHHLLRGTGQKGMGIKSGDNWAIPLHHDVHEALHRYKGHGGETAFLDSYGIKDAPEAAASIYLCFTRDDALEYVYANFSENWKKQLIPKK